MVSPGSAEDVARSMKIIVFTQSTFSISSGGHDFNVNHSSVGQAGMLVGMVDVNQTTPSADKRSMTVGVGARWGDVYRALNESGVSVSWRAKPEPRGGRTDAWWWYWLVL